MPGIRYYDYGVMRREADRRMYDAQRQAGRENEIPIIRSHGEMAEPSGECGKAAEATCVQDNAKRECVSGDDSRQCTAACGSRQRNSVLQAEELLIAAILMLTLSDGGNLPLALVLLYLLM